MRATTSGDEDVTCVGVTVITAFLSRAAKSFF
jgi:hypothetical protein